jgi:hypothetical protein
LLPKPALLACPFVFAASLPALAATLRVPEDYPTLQDAVDAAQIDDTISAQPGTYPGPLLIDGRNHLTIESADPVRGKVVIDAHDQLYGIVARNLDGLVMQWLSIQALPGDVNRAGILLDGAGVAGGGPAPLSRIVIRFTDIESPGNGIEMTGPTVHVVAHCNDIAVGGDFAVGWGSTDLVRVKFSHLHSAPGLTPRYAIFAAGTCEAYSDGTTSFHNRIYRNRIDGSFQEAMHFQNVQDHVVGLNVVRLDGPTLNGADTFGIVFGRGCATGGVSFDVSVLSNDVAGARYALVLGAVDGAQVRNNKLSDNGGAKASTADKQHGTYGGAIRIGLPDDPSAPACGLDIRSNNMMGLRTPRTEPAVWIQQVGCATNNVMDTTNQTDTGRPLAGP